MPHADKAEQLWNKLLETGNYGSEGGILPAGLAARNTLRLESAMSLYGHELSDEITPLEAGLGWITKLQKGEFTGSDASGWQKEAGLKRKLVGFEMVDRGIARDEFDVYIGDEKVGLCHVRQPGPISEEKYRFGFFACRVCKYRSRN